jgi:hypothetical protein
MDVQPIYDRFHSLGNEADGKDPQDQQPTQGPRVNFFSRKQNSPPNRCRGILGKFDDVGGGLLA